MKKFLSVILAVILIFSTVSICAYGETGNDYPQTDNPVSRNFWSYRIQFESEYIKVTFSDDTSLPDQDCGYFHIYSYTFDEYYYGEDLAGETIVVPNDGIIRISLFVESDDSDYEFRITDISPLPESEYNIDYFYDNESHLRYENDLYDVYIDYELEGKIFDNKVISGWEDSKGNMHSFGTWVSLADCAENGVVRLTAVYTDLSIRTDEVFSFTNSSDNFENGYKMNFRHKLSLLKNYVSATCFNEMAVPGLLLGILLPTVYSDMIEWGGSCCGFPTAIMMQHYGMIDMLSEQGVDSVSELEPTDNLISMLNYYNATTPASILCGNNIKETDENREEEMQALYDTVASGKPVICFIQCHYIDYLPDKSFSSVMSLLWNVITGKADLETMLQCHCVILSGAYKDTAGGMTFIGYDENERTYSEGRAQVFSYRNGEDFWYYDDMTMGNICWNDDVSYLASMKAEETTNPFAWYSYYSSHNN